MKFEHYAINVEDPVAVADWYVAHCEMIIALSVDGPPYMRFLADKTGRVVVELYCNLARHAHPTNTKTCYSTKLGA